MLKLLGRLSLANLLFMLLLGCAGVVYGYRVLSADAAEGAIDADALTQLAVASARGTAAQALPARLPELLAAPMQAARAARLTLYRDGQLLAAHHEATATASMPGWLVMVFGYLPHYPAQYERTVAMAAAGPYRVEVQFAAERPLAALRQGMHEIAPAALLLLLAGNGAAFRAARRRRLQPAVLPHFAAEAGSASGPGRLHRLFAGSLPIPGAWLAKERTADGAAGSPYQAYVEQAPDALYVSDAAGRILCWNRASEALFGYSAAEIVGQHQAMLVPKWERDACDGRQTEVVGTQGHRTLRGQRINRTGNLIAVTEHISAYRDPVGGAHLGVLHSLRDESEREQRDLSAALREQALAYAPQAMLIIDLLKDRSICYANAAAERLLGHRQADLVGRKFTFLFRGTRNAPGVAELESRVADGVPFRGVLPWLDDGDKLHQLEFDLTPMAEGSQRPRYYSCLILDVTAQALSTREQGIEHRRLANMMERVPLGVCVADDTGAIRFVNGTLAVMSGVTTGEMIGTPLERWFHGADGAVAMPGRSLLDGEFELHARGGERPTVVVRSSALPADGDGALYVLYVQDVTRRRQDELARQAGEERLQGILESIDDGIVYTSKDGSVDYLNASAERMLGWTREECHGLATTKVVALVEEESRLPLQDPADRALRLGRSVRLARNALLLRRDDSELPVRLAATPVRGRSGAILGCVVMLHDESDLRTVTREMDFAARHDPLTGLINRRELLAQLIGLLDASALDNKPHALFYMDLDRFKIVNDSCGHLAGDEMLKQVAGLVRENLRSNDVLARIGGDEFSVILRDTSIESAEKIAYKLRRAVKQYRFVWSDKVFDIGISIGIAPLSADLGDATAVLNAADAACYEAKQMGGNVARAYRADDQDRLIKDTRNPWPARLRLALERDNFLLLPAVTTPLRAGEAATPRYVELSLHLQDVQDERVPLAAFISAAEREGMLADIDRWMIGMALASLRDGGLPGVAADPAGSLYALPINAPSIADPQIAAYIVEQVSRNEIDGKRLCFEIRETDLLANFSVTKQFMEALRVRDCRFTISGFGTALSSFGYIKNLPVDYIKIDSSLVQSALFDAVDAAIVRSIATICRLLGIRTIVQGLDGAELGPRLQRLEIDLWQDKPAESAAAQSSAAAPGKVVQLNRQ